MYNQLKLSGCRCRQFDPKGSINGFPLPDEKGLSLSIWKVQRMKDIEGFVTRLVKRKDGPLDILEERSKHFVSDYSKRLKNQTKTDYVSGFM